VRAAQRPGGAAELARRTHDHLVESCPTCAVEWASLAGLQASFVEELETEQLALGASEPPLLHLSADDVVLSSEEAATKRLLRLRRRALEDKCELLLRTLPEERIDKIQRARRRFHSLLLADMLIEECRRRVRNDPADALAVVELVPYVLAWTRKRSAPPHADVLLARSAAHCAKALRVAGDLPAAEQAFIALRRRLAQEPLADPRAEAEIASLEASLCIDQRRFPEAEELLARATLAARYTGDKETLARIHIQHANLSRASGRPVAVAALLERAATLLGPAADPYLFLCTVTSTAEQK